MASVSADSARITKLLKETVMLLCENSLSFTLDVHVQGLVAITVDRSTMFAVLIDENLVKNRESASGAVSSGSSGTQGRVASEQRPPAARRLALPAPPTSSPLAGSSDGTGLAWPLQSPQAVRGGRGRGPRFPVGRGRGTSRGGRGRGGPTVRGGATGVRMIRTAVSSVRFPVSRPRMQALQRAVRPGDTRFVSHRLALPPATGVSAGATPGHMPTAIVRQQAPVPARHPLPSSGIQNSSQPMMRKPSPRLAIMPPMQSTSYSGAPSGLRQQSPSIAPRQTSPVRAPGAPRGAGRPRLAIMPPTQSPSYSGAPSVVPRQTRPVRAPRAPRGAARPRLAIMPPPQQSSPAESQALLLRSPAQPRAGMPESSARLPMLKSPIRSPPGVRLQSQNQLSRARAPTQASPRHQAPAAMKQQAGQVASPHFQQLVQLANQSSSSPVNTQVSTLVRQLLTQHSQAVPAKQPSPAKPATTAPGIPPPLVPVSQPHTIAVQLTQSAAVAGTPAALRSPISVVNFSPAGRLQAYSITAAPVPAQLPTPVELLLSQRQPAAMPTTVTVTQQRVVITSAASKTTATVSHPPSASSIHASLCQTRPTSGVPNTLASIIAQSFGTTGAQRLGVQSLGATDALTMQSGGTTNAYLLSPGAPFSPARLQPASSQQQPTAVPLYASPTQSTAAVPLSPAHRTPVAGVDQRAGGTVPKDVVLARSVIGANGAGGDDGSLAGMQALLVKQLTGTPSKQLMYSPPPYSSPYAAGNAQQRVMSPFFPQQQQRHAPSASQPYLYSPVLVDEMSRGNWQFLSPTGSHFPVGSPQRHSLNAVPVSSRQHNLQQMSQNLQEVPSPRQSSVSEVQQRTPNPQHITSVESQVPASVQQYMHHSQDVAAAGQGQVFSDYRSKMTEKQQQVSAPVSASSVLPINPTAQQESNQMQRMHQLMLCRQQTAASNPSHVSAAAVQRGQTLPAQQPYFEASPVPSPQSMRPEAGTQRPQNQTAVSQNAYGGTESDRDTILEVIQQQAYEQVRQVKREQESCAPQKIVGAALSSHHQVALASTTGPMTAHVTTGQASTTAISHTRLVPSPAASAAVRSQSGLVASPSATRPAQALEHPVPQHTVTSAVSEPITSHETVSPSIYLQKNSTGECTSTASNTSLMSVNATLDAATLQGQSLSWTSILDESVSDASSAVSPGDCVSASTSKQNDLFSSKEKLLQLKEKVQQKGAIERGRQNIVTSQLFQLQTEIATDEETITLDDLERCSPELHEVFASDSSTSVAGCSKSGE